MIVLIDKSLEKDLKKVTDNSIKAELAEIILKLQQSKRLADIPGIKRLQGAKNCYRIRIGDYRLGLISKGQEVELVRLLNRLDIYRYFP